MKIRLRRVLEAGTNARWNAASTDELVLTMIDDQQAGDLARRVVEMLTIDMLTVADPGDAPFGW